MGHRSGSRKVAAVNRGITPRHNQERINGLLPLLLAQGGGDDLFTVDVNRIRFGPGALRELGAEVALEGVKNAAVFTDSVVAQFELLSEVLQSLRAADGLKASKGLQEEIQNTV